MCGILGGINIDIEQGVLGLLKHRGPDANGMKVLHWRDSKVSLLHARLSILDLTSEGAQPMRSRDGRWWIVYNGEIYNHKEIRDKQFSYRGHSDTETLVESIAKVGIENTLPRINGMFAFAAIDTVEGILYLVRDPFGIKPVYFSHQSDTFVFSSEIKPIKHLGLTTGIDDQGLNQFMALRYIPSPKTLWKNIDKLSPGHVLKLDLNTNTVSIKYYALKKQTKFSGDIRDAEEEYKIRLRQAIKRQLLSDVPVGILLSGGIDSALVAAMASESGSKLPCFTVGFGEKHSECEIKAASETAKTLCLPFHYVKVTPDKLKNSICGIVSAIEEPLGTTSILPMWSLVRLARQYVKVVLTGQGADEPWGGYFRYQSEILYKNIPIPLLWRMLKRLGAFYNAKPESIERGLRALSEPDFIKRYIESSALFTKRDRLHLLGISDDSDITNRIYDWMTRLGLDRDLHGSNSVKAMMQLDTRMNLSDDLLLYGDKISMSASLEARVPMLDTELVDFIESLPIEYRIRWRQGKIVHKMMAESFLPNSIVKRKKLGFHVPFGDWSRGVWKDWVEENLMEGLTGLLDKKAIQNLWTEHMQYRPDRSRQIFSLLMLSLWWQMEKV